MVRNDLLVKYDFDEVVKKQMAEMAKQCMALANSVQMPKIDVSQLMPRFTLPEIPRYDFSEMFEGLSQQIEALNERIEGSFKAAIEPLVDQSNQLVEDARINMNRALLPVNLRGVADELDAFEVLEFLEVEGIPLYLIPSAKTALRLVRAKTHTDRRKVLNTHERSILNDCTRVLEGIRTSNLLPQSRSLLDGVGAFKAGYPRSAQAMFTVTLDTLISSLNLGKSDKKVLTKKSQGAPTPKFLEQAAVWKALVLLPIWNAHSEFWVDKGDAIPHDFSRHATVHSVSDKQYNKRNAVQALMLATSLIGFIDWLLSARADGNTET